MAGGRIVIVDFLGRLRSESVNEDRDPEMLDKMPFRNEGLIRASKIEMDLANSSEEISEQDHYQIVEFIALEVAISEWEEAITWIAKGWDGIDEYDHDVYFRYQIDKLVAHYTQHHVLPAHIMDRLHAADESFKTLTYPSNRCVWRNDEFQNPEKYWYFYRWQPDCPYLRAIVND